MLKAMKSGSKSRYTVGLIGMLLGSLLIGWSPTFARPRSGLAVLAFVFYWEATLKFDVDFHQLGRLFNAPTFKGIDEQ